MLYKNHNTFGHNINEIQALSLHYHPMFYDFI